MDILPVIPTVNARLAALIRWLYRLLVLVSVMGSGVCTVGYGQSVQLQFNTTVTVPNVNSVSSCVPFTYDMSYGVVSPTTSANGAAISLKLNGLSFVSIVTNPAVQTAVVKGTAPNDSLVVTMVSPLAAGAAGNVSVQLQYPCGLTCNNQKANLRAYFTATNATNSPVGGPSVPLTAYVVDPNYQVNVIPITYDATTRRGQYYVRITPTTTPANFMALVTPVMSLTMPPGIIIRQAGTTGTRSNIPNSLPTGNFTPTSTSSAAGTVLTWTNLPTFYRGGSFDIRSIDIEFPVAQFPSGTVVNMTSGMSGTLISPACGGTTTDTGPYSFTIIDPAPAGTGCSGNQMITGLNNPWNAVFTGKQNQTRITVPAVNTGNVSLTNVAYTVTIPTNELSVTQVSGTGTGGVTGKVSYRTNLNATYVPVSGTVGNGIGALTFPTLPNGEYITSVRVDVATLPVNSNMSVNVFANQLSPLRNGSAVNAVPLMTFLASNANQNNCITGYTCVTAVATLTAEYSGTVVINQTCTSTRTVVVPTSGVQNLEKRLPVVLPAYVPGQTFQYRARFTPVTVGDVLTNFAVTDVLPAGLEYMGNLKYSNTTTPPATGSGSFTSGTSLPQFSQNGQTLTWNWAANTAPNNVISSTSDHYIYFDVRIRAGTAAGNITNCVSATGTAMYGSPVTGSCVSLTVNTLAKIDAVKWVQGDLDRNYTRYPNIGHTTDGGKSSYRFVLTNTGNVAFKNIVLTDIFPWIGDQTVAANFTRLSEWRPSLLQSVQFYPASAADSSQVSVAPITAPAGVTVSYSTQTNPCRTEFSPAYNPSGCVTGSWTTTPPSPLSATQAIMVTLAGPFAAGATLVFGVDSRSPLGTTIDKIAWNSFAYQATRNDNSAILPVAEPNKVGIDVKRYPGIGNYVWQDLNGNGRQDEPATAGVNGVTVQLWSPGGDGLSGTTDDFQVGTRLTANDGSGNPGYYLFDSLYAESYYIRFKPLPGRGFTYQNASGISDLENSDADGLTGWTVVTVLDPSERDLSWDAGLCTIPNAGADQVLCAPATTIKLPTATGNDSWYNLSGNPPGSAIDPQTGQVSGLGGGVYQFVLRSSPGCSDTITVNRRPAAAILPTTLTVCAGESVTLTAQPASTSATYTWTGPNSYSAGGQSVVLVNTVPTQSGSYTLTVTDTGCTSSTTVAIVVNALPTLSAVNNGPLTCGRGTVQLTASGNGASYQWKGPAGFTAGTAVTTTNQPGSYTVLVTSLAGCTAVTTTTVAQNNTPPLVTAQAGACASVTNQYVVSGTVTMGSTGGGTLLISDGSSSITLTVGASQTTVAYSLTGLVSGSGSHTVTATFSPLICAPVTIIYAAPASCSCGLSATLTAGTCQNNQTRATSADDYHQPTVRATNAAPGATGRYEVVLNANADGTGGTVLNTGGTAYGQAVAVGSVGQFRANNQAIYWLTVRDIDSVGCWKVVTVNSVASCSDCEPLLCPAVQTVRR